MTARTVSALIVTYQHAGYVAEAIRSALEQTRAPDEVVVVDDGSTDDTLARVRDFVDPRITIIAREHHGTAHLADTYSTGLAACHGDLVGILEGDDRWPPRKLELQLPHFEDDAIVVSHGPHAVIGARGSLLRHSVELHPSLPNGRYEALPEHLLRSYVLAVTAVVRRDTLLRLGGFRQLGHTTHWDYPTFLALARHGPFFHSSDVLGIWRKHGASATMNATPSVLEGTELARQMALATRRELGNDAGLPSEHVIESAWSDALAHQSWQVARVLLRRRRFVEARLLAERALGRRSSLRLRARFLAVYGASLARTDLEGFWSISGRRSPIDELN